MHMHIHPSMFFKLYSFARKVKFYHLLQTSPRLLNQRLHRIIVKVWIVSNFHDAEMPLNNIYRYPAYKNIAYKLCMFGFQTIQYIEKYTIAFIVSRFHFGHRHIFCLLTPVCAMCIGCGWFELWKMQWARGFLKSFWRVKSSVEPTTASTSGCWEQWNTLLQFWMNCVEWCDWLCFSIVMSTVV